MSDVSKEKILDFMEKRMAALKVQIEKDFGGNLVGRNEAFREVKFWKEAIERGVFDLDSDQPERSLNKD